MVLGLGREQHLEKRKKIRECTATRHPACSFGCSLLPYTTKYKLQASTRVHPSITFSVRDGWQCDALEESVETKKSVVEPESRCNHATSTFVTAHPWICGRDDIVHDGMTEAEMKGLSVFFFCIVAVG